MNNSSIFTTNQSSWNLESYDVSMLLWPGSREKNIFTVPVMLSSSLCVLIIVTSLVGNCWVVWVVGSTKRLRTTTNYYLVNLAIADLAVTLFCTWVSLVHAFTDNWPLGAVFCKLNSFTHSQYTDIIK